MRVGYHNPEHDRRVPINIAPEVRKRLRDLLFQPEMQGVGYSAFINRAVENVEGEIMRERTQRDQWCPVCKTFHDDPGEKTDAGRLTRPCPRLAADPRNRP